MSYASRARGPRTLTEKEQAALLRVTGDRESFRDHMIIAMSLGTGLREFELVALNIGDVITKSGGPRQKIELRVFKRCTEDPAPQYVIMNPALRMKMGRFIKWKKLRGESLEPHEPLFIARGGRRLGTRSVRKAFAKWRELAELSPMLKFHALRHTFCQNVYDEHGDIRLVQKVARHLNINTSTIYAEPSINDQINAVRDLPC